MSNEDPSSFRCLISDTLNCKRQHLHLLPDTDMNERRKPSLRFYSDSGFPVTFPSSYSRRHRTWRDASHQWHFPLGDSLRMSTSTLIFFPIYLHPKVLELRPTGLERATLLDLITCRMAGAHRSFRRSCSRKSKPRSVDVGGNPRAWGHPLACWGPENHNVRGIFSFDEQRKLV
jgi:hypothetical protein